jgi:undecaprenyl-diphosphatase
MTLEQLLFLSILQGLTEFLPVSSSGHLALFPQLLGIEDQGQRMDIALHIGTLAAIVVYYWRDVWGIGLAVVSGPWAKDKPRQRLGLCIAFATIPAVIVGLCLHYFFPDGIRDIRVIVFTTLFFGLAMGFADILGVQHKKMEDIGWRNGFLIGCAQALALVPGVSRSGVTITAARMMGFQRRDAARFSFLLGLPAMAGAALLSFYGVIKDGVPVDWTHIGFGVLFAFLSGLAAIHIMMRWVSQWGLIPFAIYRCALAGFLIVYFF